MRVEKRLFFSLFFQQHKITKSKDDLEPSSEDTITRSFYPIFVMPKHQSIDFPIICICICIFCSISVPISLKFHSNGFLLLDSISFPSSLSLSLSPSIRNWCNGRSVVCSFFFSRWNLILILILAKHYFNIDMRGLALRQLLAEQLMQNYIDSFIAVYDNENSVSHQNTYTYTHTYAKRWWSGWM